MSQIDALFEQFIALGSSDLHLSSGCKPLIRERGAIMALDLPVLDTQVVSQYLHEIMPEANRREFEERNDTGFAYEKAGAGRFRVNIFRDRNGPGGVFHYIPAKPLSAEELNLPKAATDLCHLDKGLVLVTGPSGSGRSTTLAAMIDYANRTRTGHIITIEDPIEYIHHDNKCMISQREVHNHTYSSSAALRAALREDPDIVLVAEMRDMETIELALHTAETGHLVLCALDTNTATSTVESIIDAFPSERQNQIRTMLANSLKGVITQTLCKQKVKGRVAALEILIVTRGIAATIRDGKVLQIPSAMQIGGAQGMILMNDALARLVSDGLVEPQQAYDKAVDKEDLLVRLSKLGCDLPRSDAQGPALTLSHKAVTVDAQAVAPGRERMLMGNALTICGEPFLLCPLQQVVLPAEASVYVVLGVDQWGSWTVLDVGQTDKAGDESQAAKRQSCWTTKCPTKNIWFGLQTAKAPTVTHRTILEDKICAEHKPACTPVKQW